MKRILVASVLLAACSDPPGIDDLTILKDTVDERERVPVSVVATGPGIEIQWSASGGSFVDETAAETTWIAPVVSEDSHDPASAAHTVTVTITNEDGTAEETLEVTVNNINEAPQIVSATASSDSPLPGDVLTLTVEARDGDDTDLTYTWRQLSPADKLTITGETTSEASVTMPVTAMAQGYEFSITVKDPSEEEIVRSVNTVLVVPTFSADVLPIFSQSGASCGTCHGPGGPNEGVFAFDPDDSAGVNAAHNALVYNATTNPDVGTAICDIGSGNEELHYVEPQAPGQSSIFLKISGTACSDRMPQNNPTYFDTNANQLDIIESWILAGAPNN
jgi:hypothetical protein